MGLPKPFLYLIVVVSMRPVYSPMEKCWIPSSSGYQPLPSTKPRSFLSISSGLGTKVLSSLALMDPCTVWGRQSLDLAAISRIIFATQYPDSLCSTCQPPDRPDLNHVPSSLFCSAWPEDCSWPEVDVAASCGESGWFSVGLPASSPPASGGNGGRISSGAGASSGLGGSV